MTFNVNSESYIPSKFLHFFILEYFYIITFKQGYYYKASLNCPGALFGYLKAEGNKIAYFMKTNKKRMYPSWFNKKVL